MKTKKGSFALIIAMIIVVVTVQNLFAADNLFDAIKNGKTKGFMKTWYQTNNNARNNRGIFNKENSIFDTGLMLGYYTDTFRGFGAGVTFYAVDDMYLNDVLACNCIHNTEAKEVGTWLAESYLSYKIRGTIAKIGRQKIASPLLNSDGWAVVPNCFEAVMINSTDIPATTLTAAFVTEERWLKGNEFENIAGDGILMLGAVNKSLPNSFLGAWYYQADDNFDGKDTRAIYLETGTKISDVGLAAQYMLFSGEADIAENTTAFGVKLSWQKGIFALTGAYSSVSDGSFRAAKFSDHGIKTPIYSFTISGDGDIAGGIDTDAYKISAAAKLINGLTVTANYGYYNHGSHFAPNPNKKSTSIELIAKYTGFKDITCFATYVLSDHNGVGAWSGADPDDKLSSIRIWTQYNF